ncbi:MAG: tetratricopeptide repeat protein, partial [Bacteroidota bacterium]
IGDVHYFDNNYSLARKAYLKATALHQKSDTVPISVIYNDIGLTYLISGFADSALYYYEIAFNLDMQRSDYVQASRRLRSMGNIHRERGEFEIALRFYHRAFDLVSDKEEIAEMAAYTMSIGNVFYEQEEYTKALQYYKESYSYYQRVNRPNKTMLILNNLGNVYLSLTEVDSAFSFLRDAESLKDALGETRSLAYTYHSLARTHLLVDQRDSALHYFKQAYSIRSRIKDERGKATTAIELADMYLTLSNPDESLTYLRVAGEYAKNQSNRTILMDYLRLKAKYYEVIGQYQIALDTFMKWSNIRDSIFNEEKVKVLAKQSEQELEKKEAERSLASQKARNQLIISWTLTAIGVIVIVALYLIVRQSRKIDALNRSLELLNRDMYHRKRNDYHRIMDLLDRSNFPASDSVKNMLFASSSVDDALYHESIESTNIREYLELLITDLTDSLQLSEKGISIQHSITSVLL